MNVVDLTFIENEVRRVDVAEDMAIVFDDSPRGRTYRPDGMRWEHLCGTYDDPIDGPTVKRIAAYLGPGHKVVLEDPLTIEGSLLCGGCGKHGHVTNGAWSPV